MSSSVRSPSHDTHAALGAAFAGWAMPVPYHDLVDRPEVVNEDPYGDSWLFCVSAPDGLHDAATYRRLVEED
jgi:hypothetical protein